MTAKRSRFVWAVGVVTVLATAATALPATALNGAVASAQLNFSAKIVIGEKTACTGALVDPQWVLTAKSCFTAAGVSTTSKPAVATTVTVGRTDLAQTGGSVQQALSIVPHPDRNLTLVRLSARVSSNVTPVKIATTPAAAGE